MNVYIYFLHSYFIVLRRAMYYFVEILYVLTTICSVSLESRQRKSKDSFTSRSQNSIYIHPNMRSEYEPNFSEALQKYGPASVKNDFNYAIRSQLEKEHISKWYPIQSFGRQSPFQTGDRSSLREKEDILERDSRIIKTKMTARTTQRKNRGYKSTRFINERDKYKKGTYMQNIATYRVDQRQKNVLGESKTRTRNKKHNKNNEIGDIGLYINNSHQVFYNKTHYSPYFEQLYENYDINYVWSKQKYVKEFDESFKLPPSSSNRQPYKPLSKEVTRNINKNIFPKKVNEAPRLRHKDMVFNHTMKQEDVNVKQFVGYNETHSSPNQVLYKSVNETGLNLRRWIINVMAYMGYKNLDQGTFRQINNNSKAKETQGNRPDQLFGELKNTTESKLKNIVDKGIVNNVQKASHLFQQFMKKTKDAIKQTVEKYVPQQWLQKNKTKSKPKSIRKKAFDLWQPRVHRVKDDVKVNSFIKKILNHNLRLFRTVGKKTTNIRLKKKLKDLAEAYKDKFNEFIDDTSQHKIRSRKGTERVILNSLDVSNYIVRKLINFVTDEMDEKDLRNSDTLTIMGKELMAETKAELERACLKLRVCRNSNGCSTFFGEIATSIVSLNNDKFEVTFSNLAKAVTQENFASVLDLHTDRGIRETMKHYQSLHPIFQRAAVSTIKNILTSINKPFVIYDDSNVSQLHKSIAFLEIMEILDENVPNNEENIRHRNNIKNQDITLPSTMANLVAYVKKILTELKGDAVAAILVQCKIIYT